MEWLPIETAPKDGTPIFVTAPLYAWPEVVRWSGHDVELADEIGEDGYWAYAEEALADLAPVAEDFTHWMPLPPPPQGPQEWGDVMERYTVAKAIRLVSRFSPEHPLVVPPVLYDRLAAMPPLAPFMANVKRNEPLPL
jgi:hypothetical protein